MPDQANESPTPFQGPRRIYLNPEQKEFVRSHGYDPDNVDAETLSQLEGKLGTPILIYRQFTEEEIEEYCAWSNEEKIRAWRAERQRRNRRNKR